jgi:hypothetical protein
MKLLAIGILVFWGASKGGFPFFFVFLMFLFICMALKGGRRGWYHGSYGPQHNPWQGPEQHKPAPPEDARPYQAQPGTPGHPYQSGYGSYGNEGTPTVRTDMNSGTCTVRVDNTPGTTGEPTTPLRDQPRPEEPRGRVESDRL